MPKDQFLIIHTLGHKAEKLSWQNGKFGAAVCAIANSTAPFLYWFILKAFVWCVASSNCLALSFMPYCVSPCHWRARMELYFLFLLNWRDWSDQWRQERPFVFDFFLRLCILCFLLLLQASLQWLTSNGSFLTQTLCIPPDLLQAATFRHFGVRPPFGKT